MTIVLLLPTVKLQPDFKKYGILNSDKNSNCGNLDLDTEHIEKKTFLKVAALLKRLIE